MIPFGDATESLDCMDIIIGTNMLEILKDADLFAKFKNETYVIMLRWTKTKPNIISTYILSIMS